MMEGPSQKSHPIVLVTLLLSVATIVFAWFTYHASLIFAGIFWSVIAVLFGVAFAFRVKPQKRDPAIKQNIVALQEKGVLLHHEREEALDDSDIAALSKTMKQYILVVPICIVIGLIAHFSIEEKSIGYAVLLIFLALIMLSAILSLGSSRRIIKNGNKIVVRGVVTERWKMSSGSGDDEKVSHYLKIGDRQLQVSEGLYNEYLVGDAIELHFTVVIGKSPHILRVSRIPISH